MLALDFDGVICDSVVEAWRSSRACAVEQGLPAAPDSPEYRERFRKLRPLIAEGADFLLIQGVLSGQGDPDLDAAVFRSARSRVSGKDYSTYRDLLAEFRRARIRADFPAWVTDHSLYPGIPELLSLLHNDDRMVIVSTKQADVIAAILSRFSRQVPEPRIHYAGAQAKLELIHGLAAERSIPANQLLFVDDQPEHFRSNRRGMQCRLADWGYLPPDRNEAEDPPLISREELAEVARNLS